MSTANDAIQKSLAQVDPEIAEVLRLETTRQADTIELIASENFASEAVMEATGSTLTNKYAEGYPGKRYYGGCEHVDVAERLARERAKKLFGAEAANVQPHSGSGANMAVFMAELEVNDKILAMDLAHGGHLTHGSPVNFSGNLYEAVHYGVKKETGRLDYDEIRAIAQKERPKLILAGASAYPRTIDFAAFADIAREIEAIFLVDMAHIAGLVAGGVHPNPMPHADYVTTTTHKTLRGPRGGLILSRTKKQGRKVNSKIFPGTQGGPLMHVIAAKAVAFKEAMEPEFKAYQAQTVTNAQALAAGLQSKDFELVSGGTDNHMMLVDLRGGGKGLTGKAGEAALDKAGLTVNKNMVPFDEQSPFVTSGIRIGTPAITTRGFDADAAKEVGLIIADVLDALSAAGGDPEADAMAGAYAEARERGGALCRKFPLYDARLGR